MDYKEKRFEEDIEYYLLNKAGYIKGKPSDYNPNIAMDLNVLISFIKSSQPNEWKRFIRLNPNKPEYQFYKRLNEVIDSYGLVYVLRNGFKDKGIKFQIAYFKPETSMNPITLENYKKNILTCIRQYAYSTEKKTDNANHHYTIDMVLSLNGIPIVSLELKNQITGQSVDDAKKQYMYDRNSSEKCFAFNTRFLVYFAVDLYDIYMTTQLKGRDTFFLPFNRGSNGAGNVGGAGNPENKDGYVTSYLWEHVLEKDSLMEILQKFINIQTIESKEFLKNGKEKIKKQKRIIFPRYHQLDVVNKLVANVKNTGSGTNYLIQHSAGSGKSNEIAWLVYRLANLHNNYDEPIFNSVIVVTDRRILNSQLQDTISSFDHNRGLIANIGKGKTSKHLRDAINDGMRIIVTTLQKFPVIYEELDDNTGKHFAIVVDEAHSSQSGNASRKLKAGLADTEQALREWAEIEGETEATTPDEQDELVKIAKQMATQGHQDNLSFFAFTATPKKNTLEMFGIRQSDDSFRPYHIYSMRQAIEEGFIHDVLLNYTTYKESYKIAKQIPENPDLPSTAAARAIRRFESLHPYRINQKVAIIVEQYRSVTQHKINGHGKAMVITASRLHAVRYFKEMKRYIIEHNYTDLDVLVAFSGSVEDEGKEYTEDKMNFTKKNENIKANEIPSVFKSDDFNMLIVADKYQTGFDEPYLHTLFVDKKLSGVKAVQTLSRVNRICKGKEDTYILDFVNEALDIQDSFKPFFEATYLDQPIDVNLIYTTQKKLEDFRIFDASDIEKVYKIARKKTQSNQDLGNLASILKPVVNEYIKRDDDEKKDFRVTLKNFIKWYSHIIQIVRLFDIELEKEFLFVKYLIKFIPSEGLTNIDLTNKIKLEYYKLKESYNGSLSLYAVGEGTTIYNNTKVNGKSNTEDPLLPLDEIINKINANYNGIFTEEDKVVVSMMYEQMMKNTEIKDKALSNSKDMFDVLFKKDFSKVAQDCYVNNMNAFRKIFENKELYNIISDAVGGQIYRNSNAELN